LQREDRKYGTSFKVSQNQPLDYVSYPIFPTGNCFFFVSSFLHTYRSWQQITKLFSSPLRILLRSPSRYGLLTLHPKLLFGEDTIRFVVRMRVITLTLRSRTPLRCNPAYRRVGYKRFPFILSRVIDIIIPPWAHHIPFGAHIAVPSTDATRCGSKLRIVCWLAGWRHKGKGSVVSTASSCTLSYLRSSAVPKHNVVAENRIVSTMVFATNFTLGSFVPLSEGQPTSKVLFPGSLRLVRVPSVTARTG